MTKAKIIGIMSVAFILLLSSSSLIFAEIWQTKAISLFSDDYYEQCMELTQEYKKDNLGLMFLTFSHLQEYTFNNTKYDKEKYKNYLMLLEDKTGSNDIENLLFFVDQKDKPAVVKAARRLLKAAFKNCTENEDVERLIPFLKISDDETNDLTLKTIQRIITPKRKVVSKGGTLRKKDIIMMSDPELIKALLEKVTVSSKAAKILVSIEEPVLKYMSGYDGEKIGKLENKINKAMSKRKKKYPESNWYSAIGKTRSHGRSEVGDGGDDG
ncbi:MAG: hypothetical protein BA865_05975 [Desulfobacterales bacterium S5133MH4]|nr:MAG: hypothetical protein BA865_05975 [Desulfobacterales bacterium S5133MH4]